MNSIADFAENLILNQVEDIKNGKSLSPKLEEAKASSQGAPAKDVSQIEVPVEMMRQILGEGFHPQDSPTVEAMPELVWTEPNPEPEPAPEPAIISEETVRDLLSLVEEVRAMVADLKEMTGTSSGSIGINLGPPCEDPMKGKTSKGYLSPRRNRKNALKEAIRSKLR